MTFITRTDHAAVKQGGFGFTYFLPRDQADERALAGMIRKMVVTMRFPRLSFLSAGRESDVDSIVNAVFEKLKKEDSKALHAFKGAMRGQFLSYLRRIAEHLVRDDFRGSGKVISYEQMLEAGTFIGDLLEPSQPNPLDGNPYECMARSDEVALVREAVAGLSLRDQDILVRKLNKDRSELIGQAVGKTATAVDTRWHRIKKELRRALMQAGLAPGL